MRVSVRAAGERNFPHRPWTSSKPSKGTLRTPVQDQSHNKKTTENLDQTQGAGHDLERVRTRAQWLFTVASGVLALLVSGFMTESPSRWPAALWVAAMLLLVYGVGGAAAILTVRADFRMIHAAVLSHQPRPIDRELAAAYSRMMADGESAVATGLTVFRQAVVLSLVGGYSGALAVVLGS